MSCHCLSNYRNPACLIHGDKRDPFAKNPDKMSERELRNEAKLLRLKVHQLESIIKHFEQELAEGKSREPLIGTHE